VTSYYTNLNGTGTNMSGLFTKAALKDLAERVLRTFLAVFGTAVAAGWTNVTNVASGQALAWSAAIAGVTAVIGLIAARVGDPDTASFTS